MSLSCFLSLTFSSFLSFLLSNSLPGTHPVNSNIHFFPLSFLLYFSHSLSLLFSLSLSLSLCRYPALSLAFSSSLSFLLSKSLTGTHPANSNILFSPLSFISYFFLSLSLTLYISLSLPINLSIL